MPCEHYKDALIEVAASGTAPSGELRAHLAACASCRAVLAEEESLFAAIDSGLHAAANTEVPPSLLPRVRVALDEATAPWLRWVQPLVLASAGIALAFVVFLLARPPHATPENVAQQSPVAVPAPLRPQANANPERILPKDAQTVFVATSHSHAARNSTNLHSAASSNPEVLVPPDEREAFARFLRRNQPLAEQASVSAAWAPKPPQESVEILPVEIASLTVTRLNKDEVDGQQTEF